MLGFDSCRDFDRDTKRAGQRGAMGLINNGKLNSCVVASESWIFLKYRSGSEKVENDF